jgi:GR25 family glycosyltransferase involved in LPS biosynthesis
MKIDHIYCINLERSVARREKIGKEFENEELDVEFFKGCDGKAIGKSGAFGCAQSHINIWKDVVAKGYENILIFEDDVWLEKDFKKYLEILEPPEKWDILYLGSSLPILEQKTEGHFTKCRAVGLFGYIINQTTARKLAYIDPSDLQYDIDVHMMDYPLKTWMCNKNLVSTLFPTPSTSEIGMRLATTLNFYIHIFRYFNGLEALFVILILILIRRLFGGQGRGR